MVRSWIVAIAGLAVALTAVACDTTSETVDREAALHAELVEATVGTEPFAELDDPLDLVVWIHPLGDDPIDLGVQVGVLERLDDYATIRFVDAFEEAVDEDEAGLPVRQNGVVIGLGPLRADSAQVRVERYESEQDGPEAFVASRTDGEWHLVPSEG